MLFRHFSLVAWSSAAQPVVSGEASALGGGVAPSLTLLLSSPAFFCTPNIWIAITPKQRLVRKDFGTRGFWHIISSFVLPKGWDPLISWLIWSQPPCCWGRDVKLFCRHPFQIHCWNVPLITRKNFPFLLAVAQCSLVCPGLCFWLVSLRPSNWSCSFISLCLETVLEIILFCLASIILVRLLAWLVVCHQFACILSSWFFPCF